MRAETQTLLTVGHESPSEYRCVLACDQAYAPYAAVTIASLFKHATARMDITVLSHELTPQTVRRFERIEQVTSHTLRVLKVPTQATAAFGAEHYWSNAVYLRLAAAELLQCDRVLYLDSDLIVRAPLQEIFQFDLGDNLVAGVPEATAALLERSPELNWLGLPSGDMYLNSGVMLMDLAGLRRESFLQRALELQVAIATKIRYTDQCLLNAGLAGRKGVLDSRWNMRAANMPEAAFHYLFTAGTPGIFHFNGPRKPWTDGASPALRDDWAEYLKLTDYTMPEVRRSAPPNYEQLERDTEEMRALFRRAKQ
ncbi:MAG TPA: glycosyltransferase family 8 protein [Polyangiaceae bacterium]|nr:glycosyltransferase family 8 protein [Polyangiaceae bacterium]